MNDVLVRRAQASDAPMMARIVSSWEAASRWIPVRYSTDEIAGFITKVLPFREIWILGSPIQGYISLDTETHQIGGLYYRTHGRGFGKTLINRVKESCDFLWLRTHQPNISAQRFYKREGFVEVRLEWQA